MSITRVTSSELSVYTIAWRLDYMGVLDMVKEGRCSSCPLVQSCMHEVRHLRPTFCEYKQTLSTIPMLEVLAHNRDN